MVDFPASPANKIRTITVRRSNRRIFKLTQRCSVEQYLSDFEDLANCIVGLPPPFLLGCLVSGLTPEIRHEVQAHQPLTLTQAAGLARLQEEKLLDTRHPHQYRAPPVPLAPPPALPSRPGPLSPLLPSPTRMTPPPMKRLSPKEIASRQERGLCFTCDEKYHCGHKCASKVFLIIAEKGDAPNPDILPPDPAYIR